MSRVGTAAVMGAREMKRTPVLLGLLVVLPAYLVGVFTVVAPDAEVVLNIAGPETAAANMTAVFPAFTTPMVAALLAGIAGLFLAQSADAADSRLVIAGYRARDVVLSRLALLVGVSAVGTVAAVAVMRVTVAPTHLGWYVVAVLLTGTIYGMVGLVAGLTLDRMPGVYLVLFGTMIDLFLFQNPLATDAPDAARFLPGHYPLRLAMDACFGGEVALDALGWSLLVLGVVTTVAVAAVYLSMRP